MHQNFIIPYFKWNSTCFGRHTHHHQEDCTSGLCFCIILWKVVGSAVAGRCQVADVQQLHFWQPSTVLCKTRGRLCSFGLLMMGSVSPETRWTSFKIRNNNILMHCCILLDFSVRTVLWCMDPRTSRRTAITARPACHSESWQTYSMYEYKTNPTTVRQPINTY
jgi:hypothetical protein